MDIVIGAGATGLTYAAVSPHDVLVLEADSVIGGYCKTIKQDGFVWDYSGHFFHFVDEKIKNYIYERMADEEVLTCKKHTQINYYGQMVDFPFQKNIHQLPKSDFIECIYDLYFREERNANNFKEMLYAKFGNAISNKFLVPYNEKLYACDLNNLDKEAMGRFFPYADISEIISNFKEANNESYNGTFTYPRGGAITYINSLYSRINPANVRCSEKVVKIDIYSKIVKTDKAEYHYDNLISTMPFNCLLEACGIQYDKSIYTYNKVLVFNLGFDKKGSDRTNNWIYFPDKTLSFYRVGYYDNIFNDSRMSLYVELGFKPEEEVVVESMLHRVLDDLRRVEIVTDHELVSWHSVIMDPAYVHIAKESQADIIRKKDFLGKHGVHSIGRYGSWTYCSIEDGMKEAFTLAEKLNTK